GGGGAYLAQPLGKGLFLIRQYVEVEVVGSVVGQLGLPGIQQLGAQNEDHHLGHEKQTERQYLAGPSSGEREQLGAAQTPGQPEAAQPLAAGAQQQPGQDAQQQGGNGASRYYCQGHRQIVGELPHQQAQCGQGKPVDQPAAAGQRRQLPAQYAQG